MLEFTKDYSFHHTADTPRRDGFHRHMHNGYEILYFVRGDAEYIIEGSVYRLKPYDLLFIHPRTFHYLKPLSEATYERFVIHFPADKIPPSCRDFAESSKEIYRIPRGSAMDKFFESWAAVEPQFSEQELREFLYPSVTAAMLYLRHLPSEEVVEPIRENPALENILRYIDEHPERRTTAAELSAKFYVSTSWIVHTFRRTLGLSLMQYIEKKRILYAESRIRDGLCPTDAAKLCNYENYSTFYRQYKKVLGHAPGEDVKKS
ncbi:MAG: helix-turn-helix transcriptional regulator [Clostridia bacterium]|nr:helix-turn-helix transcriptional regulator [Clostridia bacterium]